MSAAQPASAAPAYARRDFLAERVESAAMAAAGDHKSRIALDESLLALRKECARTMSIVRSQRTTPVYRRVVRHAALQLAGIE